MFGRQGGRREGGLFGSDDYKHRDRGTSLVAPDQVDRERGLRGVGASDEEVFRKGVRAAVSEVAREILDALPKAEGEK